MIRDFLAIAGKWIALPALGPVGAFLAPVVALWKAFWKGIETTFANPAVLVVMLLVFVGGLWAGIKWDKNLVVAARQELQIERHARKQADEASQSRASAAFQARLLAERLAAEKADAETARDAAIAAAQRMRANVKRTKSTDSGGQGLLGLPALSWIGDQPGKPAKK